MPMHRITKRLVVSVICGVLLASCSGAAQPGLPKTLAPFAASGAPRDIGESLQGQANPLSQPLCCVYVTEALGSSLLEYNYQAKESPLCYLNGLNSPWSIQSDSKDELIVPTASGVNIYTESEYFCLANSPTKQISDDYALDGFSLDGRTYYLAHNLGPDSYVQVCVVSGRDPGCHGRLRNASLYTPYAVTADATGVYASSEEYGSRQAALIYWPNATGSGTVLKGYVNHGAGGLYFDGLGDLLAIDAASAALYVYTGCPSACKAHGPFPFASSGVAYGSLGRGETRFMTVSLFGKIDVYQYNAIDGITYLYSNSAGLQASLEPIGIAQQL